ncbi:hypothetical protein [Streptomyces capparidis]
MARVAAAARWALGEAGYAAAYARGGGLTTELAAALAAGAGGAGPCADDGPGGGAVTRSPSPS